MATVKPPLHSSEAQELSELRERVRRLEKINSALIDRVERSADLEGSAFSMFEKAMSLESLVRERTVALEQALTKLGKVNTDLECAHRDADAARVRLRDAIESLNDGFALFDGDDRMVMCNRAYLKFWPEVEDLDQKTPKFTEVAQRVADGQRPVGAMIAPERWMEERLERHRTADGVHIQAMDDGRWLQINELRTSEGGTVGIYTDITEVKAEDARQRAQELAERNLALQTTLDTLSEGVCLFDNKCRLVAWNDGVARMLGISSKVERTIGRHSEFVDWCVEELGLDRPQAIEWRTGKGPRISTDCIFSGRNFVVRSASIAPGGMAYTFDDVTDRIRFQRSLTETAETLERHVLERTTELVEVNRQLIDAKNEAERANRSKTSFIAAASHDLLQPLNAARLFVSALAERRLAIPTRSLVRQTGVALDSVEDLLEALFEISRLDAGAIHAEIVPLDIDRILNALRIEFAPTARADGLEFEIEESGLWVSSDVRLLRRILQNFLSNALRYTESGGVKVTTRREGSEVVLTVHDTGAGIAEEKQEAIFEEFRRLKSTHKIPGKGLGLAIVRRASSMLNHGIELKSEVGVGSAFSIRMPWSAPAEQNKDFAPQIPRGKRLKPGTVIIIDNDEQILSGMAALLRNWGLTSVAATSAQDPAVVDIVKRGASLVIADYHLNDGKTGDQAIAELRTLASDPLPAIVITADRSDEIKTKLAQLNLPILTKPVKPAQLRALLGQVAKHG